MYDGGWIVIQRNRKNSQLSYNKNMKKDLVILMMHTLTQRGQWEMRVDYKKIDKTWSYLHYNQFSVGSASEEYPLTVGGFTGVGTDWLQLDHSMGCYTININTQPPNVGLFSEMKIRPKDCITQ